MRIVAVGLVLCSLSGCSSPPPPPAPPPGDPLSALSAGDAATALQLATQRVAEQPGDANALRVLSQVAYAAGDYDMARSASERALRSAPDNAEVRFTALRIQAFYDPAGAAATAQSLTMGSPHSAAPAVQAADMILYEAASAGADAPQAARRARALLLPFAKRVEGTDLKGDYLAVVGNSYLLEGDLSNARRLLQEALDAGVGMPDRVTDLASALAWIAFRQGDEPACGRFYDQAMAALLEGRDAFVFLPKWETFAMLRAAFTGEAPAAGVSRMDALRERMRRQGFRDLLSYREDRQLYAALEDAWRRSDYAQGVQLLAWRTPPRPPDYKGESRLEPGCFYRKTVAEPAQRAFRPLFLARLAERSGRPAEARKWRAGEPAEGPDPAETLRILQRFARHGWAAPLYESLQDVQRSGVTLREFEERGPSWAEAVTRIERAVAALDAGRSFLVEPLARPVPGEEWTERAALQVPGAETLLMHREDGLWVVTGR